MSAMVDDFSIHKRGDLGHGVVCRTVEFEGFRRSRVIFDHLVESFADIDGLRKLSIGFARRRIGDHTWTGQKRSCI